MTGRRRVTRVCVDFDKDMVATAMSTPSKGLVFVEPPVFDIPTASVMPFNWRGVALEAHSAQTTGEQRLTRSTDGQWYRPYRGTTHNTLCVLRRGMEVSRSFLRSFVRACITRDDMIMIFL